MKKFGITRSYSTLSNSELDQLLTHYKELRPTAGLRFMMGHLRNTSLRVQKVRVQDSMKRVDGIGSQLRRRAAVKRREYSVPGPNHLWHIDGHHKLIRWGIVVHGAIDGYDRMVCCNKTASETPSYYSCLFVDYCAQSSQ